MELKKVEQITPIVGFNGRYGITKTGEVFSYLSRIRMKPQINKHGYLLAHLIKLDGKDKYITVHRIVANTFIPNPENLPVVNHINGIKTDNRVENLEWCTVKQNSHHALKTGLTKVIGEENNNSKLTELIVLEIRSLRKSGMKMKELEAKFKIGNALVQSIIYRKTWKHI